MCADVCMATNIRFVVTLHACDRHILVVNRIGQKLKRIKNIYSYICCSCVNVHILLRTALVTNTIWRLPNTLVGIHVVAIASILATNDDIVCFECHCQLGCANCLQMYTLTHWADACHLCVSWSFADKIDSCCCTADDC